MGLKNVYTAEEDKVLLVAVTEQSATKQQIYHVMTELVGDFVEKHACVPLPWLQTT